MTQKSIYIFDTNVNKTLIKLQFVSFHSNCNEIKFLHSQYINLCSNNFMYFIVQYKKMFMRTCLVNYTIITVTNLKNIFLPEFLLGTIH